MATTKTDECPVDLYKINGKILSTNIRQRTTVASYTLIDSTVKSQDSLNLESNIIIKTTIFDESIEFENEKDAKKHYRKEKKLRQRLEKEYSILSDLKESAYIVDCFWFIQDIPIPVSAFELTLNALNINNKQNDNSGYKCDMMGMEEMEMDLLTYDDKYGIGNLSKHMNRLKNIGYSLFSGLSDCKNNNIIHGDIKPENILINEKKNGRIKNCKIADFGGSVHGISGQTYCLKDIHGYTPEYVAPEVLSYDEESKTWDTNGQSIISDKFDVWSVGCVLYLLYHGKEPFGSSHSMSERFDLYGRIINLEFENKDWTKKMKTKRSRLLKDLLLKIFVENPNERISAQDALQEAFFFNGNNLSISIDIDNDTEYSDIMSSIDTPMSTATVETPRIITITSPSASASASASATGTTTTTSATTMVPIDTLQEGNEVEVDLDSKSDDNDDNDSYRRISISEALSSGNNNNNNNNDNNDDNEEKERELGIMEMDKIDVSNSHINNNNNNGIYSSSTKYNTRIEHKKRNSRNNSINIGGGISRRHSRHSASKTKTKTNTIAATTTIATPGISNNKSATLASPRYASHHTHSHSYSRPHSGSVSGSLISHSHSHSHARSQSRSRLNSHGNLHSTLKSKSFQQGIKCIIIKPPTQLTNNTNTNTNPNNNNNNNGNEKSMSASESPVSTSSFSGYNYDQNYQSMAMANSSASSSSSDSSE